MGLTVRGESASGVKEVDMTYGGYTELRNRVVGAVMGPEAGKAYADQMKAMLDAATSGDSRSLIVAILMNRTNPNKFVCTDSDLKLFIEHPDCGGEFTRAEAARLHAMFLKHKKAYMKTTKEKDMRAIFNGFVKVLKVASGEGGRVLYT